MRVSGQLQQGDRVLIAGRREGITEGYIAQIAAATATTAREPGAGTPDLAGEILAEDGCLEIALIGHTPNGTGTRFVFAAIRSHEGWADLRGQRLTITKTA